MRQVVLDTNAIISARLSPRGAPARLVMNYVLTHRITTVTCPSVIHEHIEVIQRPKFARFGFPPPWLVDLVQQSVQLQEPPPWPHRLPDSKDAPFLQLAHAAGAWLVTGNLKHFPEEARHGVTVISPAEYLARLEQE